MLKIVQTIESKLTEKIHSDIQIQSSHYARIVDKINEIKQQKEFKQEDLQPIIQLFHKILNTQIPGNVHQIISNALASLLAIQDQGTFTKIIEMLLYSLNKKGYSAKLINVQLLVRIVTMPNDINIFTYQQIQDISSMIIKMLKISDIQCRILLCQTFRFVHKDYTSDLIKYSIKFSQNEKSEKLKELGIKTLIYILNNSEGPFNQYIETITNLSFRQDDNKLQLKLFEAYLNHQQSFIQLSGKKNDKNKQIQTLTLKEEATKIFQQFNDNLGKFPSNMIGKIFLAYKNYLFKKIEKHGLVIVRGAYEVACSCLNRIPMEDPYIHTIYKQANKLCIYLTKTVHDKMELFEYFIDKIKKKNYKNIIYTYKLILKGINIVFDTQTPFDDKRQKPSDIIELFQNVFEISDIPSKSGNTIRIGVQRNLYSILLSFFVENPKWQYNILSALLYYIKISFAEISVKETPATLQTLSTQCICLASLFKNLNTSLHSTPFELINQLWDTCKQFIQKSPHPILQRTGWIGIAELMTFPQNNYVNFTSQNKLKDILVLIQESFNNLNKEINEENIDTYRAVSLVSIALVNGNSAKNLSDSMRKFLAQQLILLFQAINLKDRSNWKLISAKYVLFQALRMLNPKHYASHLNALVQFSVDEALQHNIEKPTNHYFDEQIGEARSEQILGVATMKFLGHVMACNSFTLKNKINFVKYLNGNMQTLGNLKNNLKLSSYMYILHFITNKLLQIQIHISEEFDEQIYGMLEICWNSEINQIQKLCAQVYCAMISNNKNRESQLNKFLSSQKQQLNKVFIYLVEQLIDKKISGIELQIQNLFMKIGFQLNNNSNELIQEALQLFEKVDSQLVKNCFVFIVFSLMKENQSIQIPPNLLVNYIKSDGSPNNYYDILYQECRCSNQYKKFAMIKLNYLNQLPYDVYTLIEKSLVKQNFERMNELLEYVSDKNLDLNKLMIYLNSLFSIQRVKSQQVEIDIRRKMKTLLVKSFSQDQNILEKLQPYILGEFLNEDRKIPIHIKLRTFLLKRLQKNCSLDKSSIFNFLFKIITSNYDETKKISFTMFERFFSSISKEEVLNYAAEIDSILSETVKQENDPEVSLLNMRILGKFVKIIYHKDASTADKLVNLLMKSVTNNKVSQFYSEKAQNNIFIQRVLSLISIYLKFPQLFQSPEILINCVEDLIQDFFIILCTPRQKIRSHTSFNFLSSGKKHSYDSQFIHQALPKLLRVSNLTSITHYSLLTYVITQQSPLEQVESYLKKTVQTLNQSRLEQIQKYRIKGVQLLERVLELYQINNIKWILDILPILIEITQTNQQVFSQFYFKLSKIKDLDALGDYVQALIISVYEIYASVQDKKIKLQCLETLFNFSNANEETEKVLQCYWDFLLNNQYNLVECIQLLQKIKIIAEQTSEPEFYQTLATDALQQIKNKQQLNQQDYHLILNMLIIITLEDQMKLVIEIIQMNFQNILIQAAQIFNQNKQCIPQIHQLMLLNIQIRLQQTNSENLEIIKYILLSYILHSQKQQAFLPTLKFLLLFIDPNQSPQVVQTAQGSLKHVISISDFDCVQLPQKLQLVVNNIRAQIEKERQEQEQAKQQSFQQSGMIKLKRFGQK